MIPVLYHFTFATLGSQLALYAVALGLVLYIGYSGWQGAAGPIDPKTGKPTAATPKDRLQRAAIYGLAAAALAKFGLSYALPGSAFLGEKGQGIPIHTYGILVGGGLLGAIALASRLAEVEWRGEQGRKMREKIQDLGFWVFVGGIGGARLLFMIVNWDDTTRQLSSVFTQAANPFDFAGRFASFIGGGGGLVFYGGLIGATIASWLFARANGIQFMRLADLAIPTVSFGQCLGRLGCFSAGCCWGGFTPSGSHVAVHFPGVGAVTNLFGQSANVSSLAYSSQAQDARFVIEATGQVVHDWVPGAVRISEWVAQHHHTLGLYPTQLFESAAQFLVFLTLVFARRWRRFHGQIFAIWLIAYAVIRSTNELFRGDLERGTLHGLLQWAGATGLAERIPAEAWFNVSTSQFISLCMFALGATILARHRPAPSVAVPPSVTPAAA